MAGERKSLRRVGDYRLSQRPQTVSFAVVDDSDGGDIREPRRLGCLDGIITP